ncbi:MAG: GNAT family N-acetyltransferase [Candidatus Zixiibacteriota bacterium]
MMNFTVRPIGDSDRAWALNVIRGWGADFIVSRGRKIYAAELPGFIAESSRAADVADSGRQTSRSTPGGTRGTSAADEDVCRPQERASEQTSGRPGGLPATEKTGGATEKTGEAPENLKLGLVTYEIIGDQCEVVTLDAFTQFAGVGTALMERVIDTARASGCRRVWLITTNDNLDAIRFYQKRGFTIGAVHVNAIAHSRTLKPSIAMIGNYGIPIRDEIEFEMVLR